MAQYEYYTEVHIPSCLQSNGANAHTTLYPKVRRVDLT